MSGHVGQDCRERPDTDRSMLGNREMMFALFVGGESKMATSLASDRVAELAKGLSEIAS